jgi:hypothetical protein
MLNNKIILTYLTLNHDRKARPSINMAQAPTGWRSIHYKDFAPPGLSTIELEEENIRYKIGCPGYEIISLFMWEMIRS